MSIFKRWRAPTRQQQIKKKLQILEVSKHHLKENVLTNVNEIIQGQKQKQNILCEGCMNAVVFKFHSIKICQPSGIDLIKLCNSKFELQAVFEKIVQVSSSGSASYIEELICRAVDYTGVSVSLTDHTFCLIPCLHAFGFLIYLILAVTYYKMFHLFLSSNVEWY